jgi:hypothetical protein
LNHLPPGIRYDGVDIDTGYISYAQSRFGSKGALKRRAYQPRIVGSKVMVQADFE